MRRLLWAGLIVLAVILVAGASSVLAQRSGSYTLEILMPSAERIHPGDVVMIDGRTVGEIRDVGVHDGKALVTVTIQDKHAPLHYGTTARITWEAVITNGFLELIPGPEKNPAIPSGNRIESSIERVELDDVLAALDPKMLNDVNSLVQQLKATLEGRERSLQATLKTAGPAMKALGEVLQAVGSDGPAIRDLVTQLEQMTRTLAQRDEKFAATIRDLGQFTSTVAQKQEQLKAGLAELPPTIEAATGTLDRVPEAVDETVPLLEELRPATRQLPEVAGNLSPVLQQLRPTVEQLHPTLVAANSLLGNTPELLDSAHAVLPAATETVRRLQPAIAFLRPYTPELAGWVSNWTSIWSGEDAYGNYARPLITESATAAHVNPGVLPPGLRREPEPAPGSLVDQPWTDATGDGIR